VDWGRKRGDCEARREGEKGDLRQIGQHPWTGELVGKAGWTEAVFWRARCVWASVLCGGGQSGPLRSTSLRASLRVQRSRPAARSDTRPHTETGPSGLAVASNCVPRAAHSPPPAGRTQSLAPAGRPLGRLAKLERRNRQFPIASGRFLASRAALGWLLIALPAHNRISAARACAWVWVRVRVRVRA